MHLSDFLVSLPESAKKMASEIATLNSMTFYHGTNNTFDTFDANLSADGHAQEGPGFYLTSDENDANRYGKNVMRFRLHIKKLLPTTGRANKAQARAMMAVAPDLDDTLTGWDENPHRAFETALSLMLEQGSPKAVFEQIWYDFYRNSPAQWLEQMVKFGYSGIMIPKSGGVIHFICFDRSILERLNG